MDQGSTSKYLISVQEFAEKIFESSEHKLRSDVSENLKIIDSSLGGNNVLEAFYENAIPGARFLNVMKDLKDPNGEYPNSFPPHLQTPSYLGFWV